MSKILVIILWLLLGLGYWWAGDQCCQPETVVKETVKKVVPVETKRGPLLFSNSFDTTVTNDDTEKYLTGIVGAIKDNERLHLVGQYSKEEENNTNFTTLGIARAQSTKNLLSKYMDTTGVTLSDELIPSGNTPTDNYFTSVRFENKRFSAKIKEIDNRTLIYFPYNSTQKLSDAEIEAYLDDVAKRVNDSGEKVSLTGHTDSFGDAPYNYQLGLARARVIAQYLRSKGVPSGQLITDSKGETSPISPNNTREGRSKNRRTELIINK